MSWKSRPNSDYRAKQTDARAFKIAKALLGCGRSPHKAETTGPSQKQTSASVVAAAAFGLGRFCQWLLAAKNQSFGLAIKKAGRSAIQSERASI